MKLRLAAFLMAFAVLGAFVLAPLSANAAPKATAAAVPVPIDQVIPGVGTFTGTFTLDQVVSQGGNLVAVGTVTGTLTDLVGNVIGSVTDLPVQVPLTATATCDILHLELGPLDLDLLGLVIHLDKVVLDIDAQSAPGNLLGNLLCAVAHLLDSNASGNALANLLNRILGLLG